MCYLFYYFFPFPLFFFIFLFTASFLLISSFFFVAYVNKGIHSCFLMKPIMLLMVCLKQPLTYRREMKKADWTMILDNCSFVVNGSSLMIIFSLLKKFSIGLNSGVYGGR